MHDDACFYREIESERERDRQELITSANDVHLTELSIRKSADFAIRTLSLLLVQLPKQMTQLCAHTEERGTVDNSISRYKLIIR